MCMNVSNLITTVRLFMSQLKYVAALAQDYKTLFMLSSTEHGSSTAHSCFQTLRYSIYHANKCKNENNGILTFMSMINFMLR